MGLYFINIIQETETEEGVWEGKKGGETGRLWGKKKANKVGLDRLSLIKY